MAGINIKNEREVKIKMKKRFSSMLLALCFVMVMVPVTALAADTTATATDGTTITSKTAQEELNSWAGEGAIKTETTEDGITTITLLKNFNLSAATSPVTFGNGDEDKMVLDLNGYSITSVTMVLVSRCDLTIKDSAGGGKVSMDTSSKSGAAFEAIVNQKKLTIESGSFEAKIHGSNSLAGVIGSAVANVETTINGGNFSGNTSAINVTSGTTTINGGKFDAGTYGVAARNTAVVNFPTDSTAIVIAQNFPIVVGNGNSSSGKVNIDGGSFEGMGNTDLVGRMGDVDKTNLVKISGGTFTKDPTAYVADDTTLIDYKNSNGNTTVYAAGSSSIEDTLAGAVSGDTVTVLKGTKVSVPAQVTVENKTGNEIAVNGQSLSNGESVVAHTFSGEWTYDNTHHWHKCTNCDEIADKAEHLMGEWVVEQKATETEKGSKYRVCSSCGYKETAEIDVVAHKHSAVKVEAKAATSTVAGNIAYWYCSDCGKYFSDEALTTEIAQEDTVIPVNSSATNPTIPPKTGDSSNLALWIGILVLAAAGMTGTVIYGRKRRVSGK